MKKTEKAPARYYILNGIVHELAPGQLLPPALRPPKPKKRYTAAEKELIKAGLELTAELQKWKQQEEEAL